MREDTNRTYILYESPSVNCVVTFGKTSISTIIAIVIILLCGSHK